MEARVSSGAALVTGAGSGIGRAIALGLAGAGYDVVVHYRRSADAAEETRTVAEGHGVRAITLAADVADPAAASALVGDTRRELGRLDVLVNNVGTYVHKPLEELTIEEWDDVIATNLTATFATCRAAVP